MLDAVRSEATEAAVLPVLARLVSGGQGQAEDWSQGSGQGSGPGEGQGQSFVERGGTHVAAHASVRVDGIVEAVIVLSAGHVITLRGLTSAHVWAELPLAFVQAGEAVTPGHLRHFKEAQGFRHGGFL